MLRQERRAGLFMPFIFYQSYNLKQREEFQTGPEITQGEPIECIFDFMFYLDFQSGEAAVCSLVAEERTTPRSSSCGTFAAKTPASSRAVKPRVAPERNATAINGAAF